MRCDMIGAAKSAFKGWPVLGAVLFEGDNCVHVVGDASRIRLSEGLSTLTVAELVDELADLPEQCEVMLGCRHGKKSSRCGRPEFVRYSAAWRRVYLVAYVAEQRHIGQHHSVN